MNRRGFLTGLLAVAAAPAIIRPGLLMPIKPSLVPSYRLVQLGMDVQWGRTAAWPPLEEEELRVLGALERYAAEYGYVPHNRPVPMPVGLIGSYRGDLRVIDGYRAAVDCRTRRYDRFWRDYSAGAMPGVAVAAASGGA